MAASLRLAIAGVILLLLARAGRMAWRNRALARAVWRRIRARHVAGAFGLLVVVLSIALTLLEVVPVTRLGLGSLVGLTGNAVFAPVEEAAIRAGADAGSGAVAGTPAGPDLGQIAVAVGTTAFLGGLLLLLPWLAYVEERTFREGLEDASPLREAWTALRFGLVHLVMLIPLAAALAIAVAGFAYGRVYRRAHARAAGRTTVAEGPGGLPVAVAPSPARVRGEAVLEATVWHATFNSLVVLLVALGFALTWLGW